MNQWLGILRPTRSDFLASITEAEKEIVGKHFDYLVRLKDEGKLVLAGRTQAGEPFGLSIFEAEDQAAAEQIMREDPAVVGEVFQWELHPYRIAVSRWED